MQEQEINVVSPIENNQSVHNEEKIISNPKNPKAAAIIEKARALESNESLEHNNDASEAVHASEDSPIVAESMTNDAQEASSTEGIPEWGKKDPLAYDRYQKRMLSKEKETEDARIAELQNKVAYYESLAQGKDPNADPQSNENIIIDPKNGSQLDITTPEGFLRLNELKLEYATAERGKKQFEHSRMNQQVALVSKIEEARFKYKDYDDVVVNNGDKFTQPMLDFSAMMTDNSSNNNESGADFLYYLGKNQKELTRISRLEPYEQFQILLKHLMEFGKKTQKTSKAPEPFKPLSRGDASSNMNSSNSSDFARQVIRDRYKNKR